VPAADRCHVKRAAEQLGGREMPWTRSQLAALSGAAFLFRNEWQNARRSSAG